MASLVKNLGRVIWQPHQIAHNLGPTKFPGGDGGRGELLFSHGH